MADDETIKPGDKRNRTQIRNVWGGSPQGGIAPSKDAESVLIYSDPGRGEQFGYHDGWLTDDDGELVFEYTGHGQAGPQKMWIGNKAIRDHALQSRSLRVFAATGEPNRKPQEFEYLGEFELDANEPFYKREAPDENGEFRMVFVFRLRPVGEVVVEDAHRLPPAPDTTTTKWQPPSPQEAAAETTSRIIPSERNTRTRSMRKPMAEAEVKRLEAELCGRFEAHLLAHGHAVCRYQIRVKGERGLQRTDTFDATAKVLYEAKAKADRDSIRMAIGQLLDYRRHIDPEPAALAILVPEAPNPDLRDLLDSVGIALVYEENSLYIGWAVRGR
jgi:5-methylcytosine-specific restriction protein A